MTPEALNNFDAQKRQYFFRLGLQTRTELRLHRSQGLWERVKHETDSGVEYIRDWGNVTEHCLAETARVIELAELLKLDEETRTDLIKASVLHDFFKKGEKRIALENGLSWESYDKASVEADKAMRQAGVPQSQINLVDSVGHGSLLKTQELLNREDLTDQELAFLVMHYVDDYTIDDNWVNPSRVENGQRVNDLDTRMDRNEAHPRYQSINLEGRNYLNGETAYHAQRRIGHMIEEYLTEVIAQRSGVAIEPRMLPEFIDQRVRHRIQGNLPTNV